MTPYAFVADTWQAQPDSGIDALQPRRRAGSASDVVKQAKILVLSVSAGAGHVRAAEAICAYTSALNMPVEATHLDVMDFVPAGFRKVYSDFYLKLVANYPAAWGYLYRKMDEADPDSLSQRLRRWLERMHSRALLQKIFELKPDAIICTHFLPAELLAYSHFHLAQACPVWVQVTDFDLHRMWVQPGMSGYFAASDEVAFRMRAQGVTPCAIHVTGMPIMPAFATPPERQSCALELGLDPSRKTLLLMGGGGGLGNLETIAARLLLSEPDLQLIALAGKNKKSLQALQALSTLYPGRLSAQSYTAHVERFMACADLVITKSGGLTTAECLAMGLPMIVNAPIPGQEERNADFLVEQGVAFKAIDGVTLEYRVRYLLNHPEKLAEMRIKAKALGRPAAARHVIETVLGR